MKLSEWAESFAILAKYGDGPEVEVEAEQDEIYAGPDITFGDMAKADSERLQELGWRENEDSGFEHFT